MNRRTWITSAALLALAIVAPPLQADEGGDEESLRWSWRLERAGNDLTLVATGRIPEGYIVYGSDFKGGVGPRPSRIKLAEGDSVQPDGALESVSPRRRTDKTIGAEYSYFEHQAEFRQKLVLQASATHVAGRIEGQACHESDGTCQLFRQAFDVPISAAEAPRR